MIPSAVYEYKRGYKLIKKKNKGASIIDALLNGTVAIKSDDYDEMSFVKQFKKLSRSQKFIFDYYIYPFDTWCVRNRASQSQFIVSVTVDYGIILETKLNELINKCKSLPNEKSKLYVDEIKSIEIIGKRIKKFLNANDTNRGKILSNYFPDILYRKPSSFDEALQKLLFYNALFWQAEHMHVGLGRLDLWLYSYYKNDIDKGLIKRAEAKTMISCFCKILHRDVYAKSGMLIGDTGQYILLGGIGSNGNTVQNELTELFLEVITELNIPDPKIILRVNNNISNKIWKLAIDCLKTGNGSPLIINENRVMAGMQEFGYEENDIWNFGTSACWEPLIIGKSFDQNNILPNIPIITCINELIAQNVKFSKFEDFLNALLPLIKKEIIENVQDRRTDCSPLYSLFFDDCLNKGLDFARGGAKYSYHGIQIVSFPNTINALLNIKRYVYDEKLITLSDCKKAIETNYNGSNDIRSLFLNNENAYGANKSEVIELTNLLMDFISDVTSDLKINGEKIKVGYSSSEFITQSKHVKATLDGRRDYEPFAVHISPVSRNIDIQEVLDFAGSLNYSGNKMNGNVVDFILPKAYLDNTDKLICILKNAMTQGVYELQLNVLDKETLIDAKAHPDKYPNLIVRVWGFSAYFNDLPEEYKDNLIKRAECYNA